MYTKFKSIDNDGFALKPQGLISIYIFSTIFIAASALVIKLFLENPKNGGLLLGCILFPVFTLVVLRRLGRRFELYPAEKLMKSVSGFGASQKEISFDQFEGFTTHDTRNAQMGTKSGNALVIDYNKNGKSKRISLGQNLSAKTIRIITEEFTAIMNK